MFCRSLSRSALLPGATCSLLRCFPFPQQGDLSLFRVSQVALARFGGPSVESGVGQGQPSAQSRERCSLAWGGAQTAGVAGGGL